MKKDKGNIHTDKIDSYRKLADGYADVELKGDTMPYTSLNGHMFSFLSKEGSMGIRLPAEEREAFLKKYKTNLFEAHGTVLKEYVTIPDKLLKNTKELKPYFDSSYQYVKSLKPKSSKKPKASKKKN